jgi:acetyl esterase/lipase
LDPITRNFLERAAASGVKPLADMQLDEARAFMHAGQFTPYEHPSLSTEVVGIAGVTVRVVKSAVSTNAIVLYLHGGGWVLGSPDTHARIVQELALRTRATVLVPDYGLAPENRFPAALEQCYAIARAVCAKSSNAEAGNPDLVLVGDSAGGNLAAAMALLAAQRGDLAVCLQVLMCPALDPESATQSYSEFSDGFGLTAADMRWFWNTYDPDHRGRDDWRLSPTRAPKELLSKLAPALVVTAGCDVLRDEAERYAEQMWEAGATVTVVRFPGTIHNFPVIDDLRQSGSAQAALAVIAAAVADALGSTKENAGVRAGRVHQE